MFLNEPGKNSQGDIRILAMLGLELLVILLFTIAAPACCAFKPSLYQAPSAGGDAYDSAESSKTSTKETESAPGGQTSNSAAAEAKNKEAIAEGRTYEAAFRASEGIYEFEYLGREKQENISFDNPPIANYRWVHCFKGPPFGHDLPVRFEFGQTTQDKMPEVWKFSEDMMPARHSHWIIFIPNCVPEPGGFRTYQGSYGRQEASEKNISAIKAIVEKHHGEW